MDLKISLWIVIWIFLHPVGGAVTSELNSGQMAAYVCELDPESWNVACLRGGQTKAWRKWPGNPSQHPTGRNSHTWPRTGTSDVGRCKRMPDGGRSGWAAFGIHTARKRHHQHKPNPKHTLLFILSFTFPCPLHPSLGKLQRTYPFIRPSRA